MLDRLHDLARRRATFAFETTLAGRAYAPWIRDLLDSGYVPFQAPWQRSFHVRWQRLSAARPSRPSSPVATPVVAATWSGAAASAERRGAAAGPGTI